ncbi:MAG: serine hydrolase [Telluria sp.]
MLKLSPLCLASLLLFQLPVSAVQAAPVSASVDRALAARIDAEVATHYKPGEPGATLIVVKDGKTLLRKAYGMADVTGKVAMRPDASLRLGSITKQFTAVAIMMLADEGKLAMSDPITKFLPDYPTQGKLITVEHLLTHTSGIVSYTSKPGFGELMQRDMTVPQVIDFFKNDPVEFEPGSKYAYNNSGYFLLGAIIEKLSSQSYAKFVERRLFVPLGMTHTAYEGSERALTLRALGHQKTPEGFGPSQPLSMTQPYAAGALVSTVDDLAKWDAAITAGKLLKPASWKQAFTAYTLTDGKPIGYGYGWDVGKLRGDTAIAHGGGINGFSTYAVRLPRQRVYVALLTNSDSGRTPPSMIARKAAAVAIGNPFLQHQAIALGSAGIDVFAGTYQIDAKTTRVVRREGNRLLMQRNSRPPVELFAYAPDRFFLKESTDTFTFGRDDKGDVDRVTLHNDGVDSVNKRTGNAPAARVGVTLDGAALQAFVGRYEVMPGFVLELTREGDKLFSQATGEPKRLLMPISGSAFYLKEYDAEIRFDKGNSEMTLLEGGQTLAGKRM